MVDKSLCGQVIVITGGSSGIGLLAAKKAAAAGARPFLISRNALALADAVEEIEAAGGEAGYAVADVGEREALQRAAEAAVARFGSIDCWVSNAGVAIYAPLLETPADEHERLFRTNYFGMVHSAQVAVPYLEATGGTLIMIGSIAGDMPSPVMGAYTASKHAVHGFAASLRIELQAKDSPVAVTLIKPSGMMTPIADHAANHMSGRAQIPPPPYDPELVADAILHAATHRTRNLTVGSVGRLQVLFAAHFAALFERIAPIVEPFLVDRRRRPVGKNNLFAPAGEERERSPDGRGQRTSLMLSARRHPAVTVASLAGVAVGIGFALVRKR